MVNTAFTVKSEGREAGARCAGKSKREKNLALVTSVADKIQGPRYRHPHWISSDSGNSTDTNALSAGADSPGEKVPAFFL